MSKHLLKTASFGGSKTGLLNVGYSLINSNNTVLLPRTIIGVYELSGGSYACYITFSDYWKGSIVWDTGEIVPVYACEDYNDISISGIPSVYEIDNELSNKHGDGSWE